MTQGLAAAFGAHVRANAILAGAFLTDVSAAWDMDDFTKRARRSIVLKRAGHPDEIAGPPHFIWRPTQPDTPRPQRFESTDGLVGLPPLLEYSA